MTCTVGHHRAFAYLSVVVLVARSHHSAIILQSGLALHLSVLPCASKGLDGSRGRRRATFVQTDPIGIAYSRLPQNQRRGVSCVETFTPSDRFTRP
jgi:hypothetical protein